MQLSRPMRIAILALTAAAVFWLPWVLTALLIFISGLIFPPAALAYGVLADILYYPGSGVPMATITGSILTLVAVFVRYFVKTRIM